jgi:hypothetical protein
MVNRKYSYTWEFLSISKTFRAEQLTSSLLVWGSATELTLNGNSSSSLKLEKNWNAHGVRLNCDIWGVHKKMKLFVEYSKTLLEAMRPASLKFFHSSSESQISLPGGVPQNQGVDSEEEAEGSYSEKACIG